MITLHDKLKILGTVIVTLRKSKRPGYVSKKKSYLPAGIYSNRLSASALRINFDVERVKNVLLGNTGHWTPGRDRKGLMN